MIRRIALEFLLLGLVLFSAVDLKHMALDYDLRLHQAITWLNHVIFSEMSLCSELLHRVIADTVTAYFALLFQ